MDGSPILDLNHSKQSKRVGLDNILDGITDQNKILNTLQKSVSNIEKKHQENSPYSQVSYQEIRPYKYRSNSVYALKQIINGKSFKKMPQSIQKNQSLSQISYQSTVSKLNTNLNDFGKKLDTFENENVQLKKLLQAKDIQIKNLESSLITQKNVTEQIKIKNIELEARIIEYEMDRTQKKNLYSSQNKLQISGKVKLTDDSSYVLMRRNIVSRKLSQPSFDTSEQKKNTVRVINRKKLSLTSNAVKQQQQRKTYGRKTMVVMGGKFDVKRQNVKGNSKLEWNNTHLNKIINDTTEHCHDRKLELINQQRQVVDVKSSIHRVADKILIEKTKKRGKSKNKKKKKQKKTKKIKSKKKKTLSISESSMSKQQ